jgi:hypothetical protein
MKHLSLLSDSKYLLFGVALINSLARTSTIPLTIHYFCIDEASYAVLTKLSLPNVVPYPPNTLFNEYNPHLLKLKETNFRYTCWALASLFTDYLMHTVQDCDSITYIDSDIYFHKDIKLLFDAFGTSDCGIFKHRFNETHETEPYGLYNVGVVYFKNSPKGRTVLDWWSNAVLYMRYPSLATCGDQRYLDAFPAIVGRINMFIDSNIGHGAPWNWFAYDLSEILNGVIQWKGEKQPHVFTHFSKFVYDFKANTFECTEKNTYHPYTNRNKVYEHDGLRSIHAAYFEALKEANTIVTKNAT